MLPVDPTRPPLYFQCSAACGALTRDLKTSGFSKIDVKLCSGKWMGGASPQFTACVKNDDAAKGSNFGHQWLRLTEPGAGRQFVEVDLTHVQFTELPQSIQNWIFADRIGDCIEAARTRCLHTTP